MHAFRWPDLHAVKPLRHIQQTLWRPEFKTVLARHPTYSYKLTLFLNIAHTQSKSLYIQYVSRSQALSEPRSSWPAPQKSRFILSKLQSSQTTMLQFECCIPICSFHSSPSFIRCMAVFQSSYCGLSDHTFGGIGTFWRLLRGISSQVDRER